MNFDVFFNAINDNMVKYVTGSYAILAIMWILGVFALVFMMDLGLKYALAFSLPVGIFFIGIGWFQSGITLANGLWNLFMVIIGLLLGLALLKWIGDW